MRLRRFGLVLGLLTVLLSGLACAQAEEVAAPSPAPSQAPAQSTSSPSPSPVPPVAPSQPSVTTAPSQSQQAVQTPVTALDKFLAYPDGQPLVPGGPAFYPKKLAQQEKGIQILYQYHITKLCHSGPGRSMAGISRACPS